MSYYTYQHLEELTELLIQAYPEGAKTGQLAEALNVTTQTVRNYIARLPERGVLVQESEGPRYSVDPRNYVTPMRLTQAQAWFLYLLLRRIVRADLGRYALVSSLLKRLTANLQGELAEQIQPDVVTTAHWDTLLKTLVEGWRAQTLVRIQYSAPNSTAPLTHIIAPYWFEPAVWSDSNYLIAGVRGRDGTFSIIPFKLDRVRSAALLNESFERPSADTLLSRIQATWGIWDGEPVEVVLRFNNRVADRLKETRWHPSQTLALDADGYLLWRAVIAEPQEMLPWIRGWGADVEVIAPKDLRTQIAAEAVRTAQLYNQSTDKSERQFF
jgi:CRISPR-associated endonuclease/helicase Cas3